ncbi:phytoene desaturase family protein [Leucobacter denitrificans]|uniref:NAD(P)/FAD-dependent oxidoreductase n=1 Tax=Leucobacter denitrificans TaxID=683042 RepID=A0A7G9S4N6_9MICO|nr:NAD(P)/FAD-dependent oxidoreductase [Leucobacter denitrificans]QNN62811.1 NAD(P)/FAD-dependent oxidoreductase [Leucobacter denitrificans]
MTGSAVDVDAVIVGAGPNGLAAAVTLARAGLSVRVFERTSNIGGGTATSELTLPGFHHDVCSAVHPLAFESRFFREFELAERVPFVVPEISFAHPLDGGRAGIAYRDLARTREVLGRDGAAYEALIRPLAERASKIADFTGSTLLRIPPDPLTAARFGLATLEQGTPAWNKRFEDEIAPSMLTGVAAHTILPLPSLSSAGAGLALTAYAHAKGWPIPIGGSQAIANAMVADLEAHGGAVVTDAEIQSLDDLPSSRITLLNVTPRAFLRMAGHELPAGYARALGRFTYGSAVAKVDFALSEPVPWANDELRQAGTVHLGGSRAEIAAAENLVARGKRSDSPYVLVSQPTVFDETRAPAGKHTLWTYTHVPAGSREDRAETVIQQIERFAPGFRDTIIATSSRTAVEVEQHNPNYPGGDIAAGVPNLAQLIRRPTFSAEPWRTPLPGVYLCSASTTPGPGVHGLAGWYAALAALRHELGTRTHPNLARRGDLPGNES